MMFGVSTCAGGLLKVQTIAYDPSRDRELHEETVKPEKGKRGPGLGRFPPQTLTHPLQVGH